MKILIACGGTGGHIFPALATVRDIKKNYPSADILFVSSRSALDAQIFTSAEFASIVLEAPHLPKNFIQGIFVFIPKIVRAIGEALVLVKRFAPDVVVGFGGYTSVPVLTAAALLRKKILIHEQNAIMGKANRFLAKFADRVALSFPPLPLDRKYVLTGNPIRAALINQDRREVVGGIGILILGGSQGSRALNAAATKAFELMSVDVRKNFRVIHITGVQDYDFVAQAYSRLGVSAKAYSFLDEISLAYAASDIAISRCGASAIYEIAASGLASILVPYPYAMNHQLQNAMALSKSGGAVIIEEKNLSPELLREKMLELTSDFNRLQAMKKSAKETFSYDGAARLALEIVKVGNGALPR